VGVSFDRAADYYDRTRSHPDEAMAGAVRALVELLGTGGGSLEIGAGTGRFSVPLQRAGLAIVPIDISRPMLQAGVGKGLRDPVRADAALLPFRDDAFASALSAGVLGHLADPRHALREIARTVRGNYIGVAQRHIGFDPLALYTELLHEAGQSRAPPEVTEESLSDHVPPRRVLAVSRSPVTFRADVVLDRLSRRFFSETWDVPEAIQQVVLERMRDRLQAVDLRSTLVLEAHVWDVKSLGHALTP